MKAFTALILVSIIVSVSIFASSAPALASAEPSVGVKEGDWMEYNVNITGNCPPVHKGVVWMHIDVLQVEDTAFPANLTLRFENGTVSSSIWQFNFTAGNDGGWIIIPSNLSPGETFFDNFSKTDKNITIQIQEQKDVLGASRTITHANDSYRDKEWDKATGVFTNSSEIFRNWSARVNIIATNLWSPQILGLDQTVFYAVTTSVLAAVAIAAGTGIAVVRRKKSLSNR